MFRHQDAPRLASAALLLLGAASVVSSSPQRDHDQVSRNIRDGGNIVRRSLQTCSATEGFTVTSDAFPLMSGCYTEEEVPQNGGGSRLVIMKYSSSDRVASFDVGPYDPYSGYRWLAGYYKDGTFAGGDWVIACKTNEDIGMDLQPADPTFTWECDLDGDGTMETPIATDAMLSVSCGCEASPSPAPITPISTTTPAPVTRTTPTPITPVPAALITPVPAALEPTAGPTTPKPVAPTSPALESFCSNGLVGIEADEVCCDLACGFCGGVGCGNVGDLSGDQCCSSTIGTTGELCSVTGAAPCRIDPPEVNPSTCPNGLPGVAEDEVCCLEACNTCGGVNCGTIAGTNGSSDCCTGAIIASGVLCDDTGAAPCIMAVTPSPTASPNTPSPVALSITPPPASLNDFTMAPTDTVKTAAPTTGYVSRGGEFGSVAPTGSPTAFVAASTLPPTLPLSPGTTSAPGAADVTLSSGEVTTAPVGEGINISSNGGESSIAIAGAGGVGRLAVVIGGAFAAFAAARA